MSNDLTKIEPRLFYNVEWYFSFKMIISEENLSHLKEWQLTLKKLLSIALWWIKIYIWQWNCHIEYTFDAYTLFKTSDFLSKKIKLEKDCKTKFSSFKEKLKLKKYQGENIEKKQKKFRKKLGKNETKFR